MKSFIADIYERLMVPLPQSSKWWGRRCQFVAGFLLTLYWTWYFVAIMPGAFLRTLEIAGFNILGLSIALVFFIVIPCFLALLTFIIFCGVPKEPSKYIFEYRTPPSQSKWARGWRILSSFLAVIVWSHFLSRTDLDYLPDAFLFFMLPIALILTLVFCGLVHIPELAVLVSHNDVVLSELRSFRRRIPMSQIKSMRLISHMFSDFSIGMCDMHLYKDSSYGIGFLGDGLVYTAELELNDGRRISVCFKGVEKFVEEVNRVLALN